MSEDPADINDKNNTEETTPILQGSLGQLPTQSQFDFAQPGGSMYKILNEEGLKYAYPTKFLSTCDRDTTVSTDHCYARPWNWRPDANFLRQTKLLFISRQSLEVLKLTNPLMPNSEQEVIIDVDSPSVVPPPIYDVQKTKCMMDECEKHAFSARADRGDDDWEEKISKISWSPRQNRIFSQMVDILNDLALAKLSQAGNQNEAILRRTSIDKAVQRVRKLLATVVWEPKVTQWLHQLLVDNLDPHYLSCYLDILQTLKTKLPTFVDKMLHGPNPSLRMGPLNNVNLMPLLEKHWDPIIPSLQEKSKKLPGNPIIVFVPLAPIMMKMTQKWIQLFSSLATVITIPINFGPSINRMTSLNYLDQLFSLTRGKIQDVKADYPGRNIILVGFRAGATLALQVALVEPVLCVISLGFSFFTAEGRRGQPDDNLLDLQCPVLFVVGQCSNNSLQEDMEDLRDRMRVETGLIIVGSADDSLRISKKKKRTEGITQSIIDRCIIDEAGDFISGIILSPFPPQIRQSPNHPLPESTTKKGKNERTRYNSNASSLDSEPPSPTSPRIHRPVGRPPGSRSKSRLDAKWAQQITQGNVNNNSSASNQNSSPSTSPPPYPSTPTPDTSSNDSSLPEKQPVPSYKIAEPPVKKLRTLKPVVDSKKSSSVATPSPSQGSHLSALLQSGVKSIPPSQAKTSASGIKVLENVTLNSNTTAQLLQSRNIDLSKLTFANTKTINTTVGNVMILPDGKIKTVQGTSSILKGGKHMPVKRHGSQKTSKQSKTSIYMPSSSALPPPTNLTTQDIMDLPIIFADDNKMLDPNLSTNLTAVSMSPSVNLPNPIMNLPTVTAPKVLHSVGPGKFMVINKQPLHSNYVISSAGLKKQPSGPSTPFNKPPARYTKIILSQKKPTNQDESPVRIGSSEITVKKVQPQSMTTLQAPEMIDLETEIKAITVPKSIGLYKSLDQKLENPLVIKRTQQRPGEPMPPEKIRRVYDMKKIIDEAEKEDDPDYLPPKTLKFE